MSLAICVLLVITVLLAARFVLPMADDWRENVQAELSAIAGAPVTLGALRGHLVNFNPAVEVSSLIVYQPENPAQPTLELDKLTLELDTIQSIITRQLVFRRLRIGSGHVQLSGHSGKITLAGFLKSVVDQPVDEPPVPEKESDYRTIYDLLAQQRLIDFRNITFAVSLPDGQDREITIRHMMLSGAPESRTLSATIDGDNGQAITLSLSADGQAEEWPNVILNGYLSLPVTNFKPWLSLLPEKLMDKAMVQVNQLETGAELWFSYSPPTSTAPSGWDVRGHLRADMIDADIQGKTIPPVTGLETDLSMTFGRKQPARIWLEQFSFQFAGRPYPASDLYLSLERKPEAIWQLAADRIHLQALAWMANTSGLLPEKLDKVVSTLAPRGRLENVVMQTRPSRKPFDFTLVADLREVRVDNWKKAPSGEHINARLHMTADAGVIDLDSPGFKLGLESTFEDVWTFDRAKGQLYWRIKDDVFKLRTDGLALGGREGDINTRFRLDVPFAKGQPLWLALEAGITNGDITYAKKFLPNGETITQSLTDWLNGAIKGANISQGAFILDGPLTDSDRPLSWGLFMDIDKANIAYSLDWPELKQIKGTVIVDQDKVLVTADSGKIYNSDVTGLRAYIPDLRSKKPLIVAVSAKIDSNGEDAQRVLRESALATFINHAADNWQITGPLSADLDLDIPLKGRSGEDIQVDIQLDNNGLVMPDLWLSASAIAGQFHYSSKKGLYGKRLKGKLQGEPLTLDILSKMRRSSGMETRLTLNGRVATSTLSEWLETDLSDFVQGEARYNAGVTIGSGNSAVMLDIRTDLVDVSSALPEPFAKSAGQKGALDIRFGVRKGKPVLITSNLVKASGQKINSLLELDSSGQLERMGINFGQGMATLPGRGVTVTGRLDTLKLEPWGSWWRDNKPVAQKRGKAEQASTAAGAGATFRNNGLLSNLHVRNFHIEHLLWDKELLSQARINFNGKPDDWKLAIVSQALRGSVTQPAKNASLQVSVARIVLPEPTPNATGNHIGAKGVSTTPASDILAEVDPSSVPPMNVEIKEIVRGGKNVGSLSFALEPIVGGLQLSDLQGWVGGADLNGSLEWTKRNQRHQTSLMGVVNSKNIDQLLEFLGYPGLLSAKKLESQVDMRWQGSPAGFSINNVQGNIGLNMSDGRFDSMGASGSEALRLFGVLNIDTITRRLRLDFSDLYKSGMAFDRVRGRIVLDNGLISLVEPITIKGPSSDFKLSGQLSTKDQNLDMGLVVTLPVTKNIAVVSLLLGQPYVAGAAYLFDKFLGNRVEKFASLRYEIKGGFQEPEVKLDKLFSNREKRRH